MTTTTATQINASQTIAAVASLRWEMGIRNVKASDTAVYFQVGMASSTSWVEISLTPADTYAVEIFKLRGVKRTTLAAFSDVDAAGLASYLLATWCGICSERGW